MNTKKALIFILNFLFLLGLTTTGFCQYSTDYVTRTSASYAGHDLTVLKMSRKDGRVKVKYFAGRDNATGKSVYDRYQEWASGRKIICFSSGTFMTDCDPARALPVGLCIDNGVIINNTLETTKFDALAIVYATGGMAVSNLKERNLSITYSNGSSKVVNVRDPFERNTFNEWARQLTATVFQTQLIAFKNQLMVYPGPSKISNRRFLVVGKDYSGTLHHLFVSTIPSLTVYESANTAYNYVKNSLLSDVIFMINVDPGCQDVYKVYNEYGGSVNDTGYYGSSPTSQATNLIVYYYE